MHVWTDSIRRGRPDTDKDQMVEAMIRGFLWKVEYWLVQKAQKEYTIFCSRTTFEISLVEH